MENVQPYFMPQLRLYLRTHALVLHTLEISIDTFGNSELGLSLPLYLWDHWCSTCQAFIEDSILIYISHIHLINKLTMITSHLVV